MEPGDRRAYHRTCLSAHSVSPRDVFCPECGSPIRSRASAGAFDLMAEDLTVRRGGRVILDNVSLVLPPGSLVAVVGPDGSGTGDLLGALAGTAPADWGDVRYAGHTIAEDYDVLRHAIGFVPAQDLLPASLPLGQGLELAAELRFPDWVTAEERSTRIGRVLDQLAIADVRETRVGDLPADVRKRADLATELLVAPTLLLVDRPAAGLDPGQDAEMMRLLQGLAKEEAANRTVIVATGSIGSIWRCDLLVMMAPGGRIAYAGPPDGCVSALGVEDLPEGFSRVAEDPVAVAELAAQVRVREQGGLRARRGDPRSHEPLDVAGPPGAVAQWWAVARRVAAVLASDRRRALAIVVLPLVLAGLGALVGATTGLAPPGRTTGAGLLGRELLTFLLISAIVLGLAASLPAIAGERPLYLRDRAAGLGRSAYLLAQAAVLVPIVLVQTAVVVVVTMHGRPGPVGPPALDSLWSILVPLLLLAGACTLIGLALSALLHGPRQVMAVLVAALLVLLALSGALALAWDGPVMAALQAAVPSSWTYNALAAATDVQHLAPVPAPRPSWEPTTANWVQGVVATGLFWFIGFALAEIVLSTFDPRRRLGRAPVAGVDAAQVGSAPGGKS